MGDVIDELAEIKEADNKRAQMIASAEEQAKKLIDSARRQGESSVSEIDAKRAVLEKEIEKGYAQTYQVMVNKLNSDYSKKIKAVQERDVSGIVENTARSTLAEMKNYAATFTRKNE